MKKLLLSVAAALLITGGAASAESAAQPIIAYNSETGAISVSGTLGNEFANETVSLTVYKTTPGLSGVASAEEGSLNWYDQTTASSDGSYSFDFMMVGARGVSYTFSIAADGLSEASENPFTYYPPDEINNILRDLTTAKNENNDAKILEIIGKYDTFLQLDTSYWTKLASNPTSQSEICKNILTADISTIDKFKEAFSGCSAVGYLNSISDAAVYEQELAKMMSVDAPASAEYFNNSGDEKAQLVNDMMTNGNFKLKSELLQYFKDSVLTSVAKKAVVWGDMYSLLSKAQKEIGIDFDAEYNKLGNKGSEALQLMLANKEEYRTCENIKSRFNKAVAAKSDGNNNPPSNPGNPSSPGGGGGGAANDEKKNDSSISILPTPVKPKEYFDDLSGVKWAKESINKLYEKGIVAGDENGDFNPEDYVSRAEYVKMLVCALGMSGNNGSVKFDDVSEKAWYYDYVMTAAENGLVSGVNNNNFEPSANITRQDAAVIIYRAAEKTGVALKDGASASFSDENEIAPYAKDAVKALYASGIVNGVGDGRFAPKDNMTRAQAAVMICGFIERVEVSN